MPYKFSRLCIKNIYWSYKVLLGIIILILWIFFFTPLLGDGFSFEFDWDQVFSSIQNSCFNSGRNKCCSLDGLYLSFYFQVSRFFYHAIADCSKRTTLDYIFNIYSLILCSCLLIVSLLFILFPGNISLFPLISWFVLYLILQAFTNQKATLSCFIVTF